ncbi:MAG: hypothetical protein ACLQNV_22405 [Steroidobacteraceae bacterium]
MSNEVVDNNLEEARLARLAKRWIFFRTSNFSEHYLRSLETYDRIIRLVDLKGKRIAETGHLSGISCYLKENGINVIESTEISGTNLTQRPPALHNCAKDSVPHPMPIDPTRPSAAGRDEAYASQANEEKLAA